MNISKIYKQSNIRLKNCCKGYFCEITNNCLICKVHIYRYITLCYLSEKIAASHIPFQSSGLSDFDCALRIPQQSHGKHRRINKLDTALRGRKIVRPLWAFHPPCVGKKSCSTLMALTRTSSHLWFIITNNSLFCYFGLFGYLSIHNRLSLLWLRRSKLLYIRLNRLKF